MSEETRKERQLKMYKTLAKVNALCNLDEFTPAELYGILETAKLEIFDKVLYESKKQRLSDESSSNDSMGDK